MNVNHFIPFRYGTSLTFIRSLHMIKKRYGLNLIESEAENFENGLKYGKHSGVRNNPCVKLPYKLQIAATSLINKYNNKKFRRDILDVNKEFHQIFIENDKYNSPANKRKININYNEEEKPLDKNEKQSKNNKPSKLHLEEPYDHYRSVAYMASRLPANYAALSYIFNEIRHEEPNFVPSTLFDFGSGVGSTIWAADHYWGNKIKEIFCVDLNENMNNISRELLEKGTIHNDNILEQIFYRQFLPAKHEPMYDLVVSAFSLLDTYDLRSRIYTVENLWKKTSGMLVIVEHGSKAGFHAVMEARNFILQISEKQLDYFKSSEPNVTAVTQSAIPGGSVVAPCPHDLICPRQMVLANKSYCNFAVNYNTIDYGQNGSGTKKEKFSYIVIKKNNQRFNFQEEQKYWPRVVEPVVVKSGHSICRLCTSDGFLKEVILSKSKSSHNMYKCARKSSWGDKLPAQVVEVESKDKNKEQHEANNESECVEG